MGDVVYSNYHNNIRICCECGYYVPPLDAHDSSFFSYGIWLNMMTVTICPECGAQEWESPIGRWAWEKYKGGFLNLRWKKKFLGFVEKGPGGRVFKA